MLLGGSIGTYSIGLTFDGLFHGSTQFNYIPINSPLENTAINLFKFKDNQHLDIKVSYEKHFQSLGKTHTQCVWERERESVELFNSDFDS